MDTDASLIVRVLALNGAVTMNTNGTHIPIADIPLFEFHYLPIIMRM